MTRRLVPLWNRVLIRRVEKVNGIHIPAGLGPQTRLQRGHIEAVGDGVRRLKKGDEVYFGVDSTQLDAIQFDGVDYIVTPVESVLAVVTEEV